MARIPIANLCLLIHFHSAGYSMTGVDIAPGMIAEAQRKAEASSRSIAYHVQDAGLLDLPGERFDLCISLFDSLNYITDPAHLQRAFERVALHLTRNGLFIFDMNSDLALREHFFDQSNMEPGEPLRDDWRSAYFPETRLCRVHMKFWAREPDGSERYLVDEVLLLNLTKELGGELEDPLKTTVVQSQRCMTTWVVRRSRS